MEADLRRLLACAESQNGLLRTFALDCVCQEFTCDASAGDPWVPFPEPTRVRILMDASDTAAPHRRFRAEYRPQVIRWYRDAAAHRSKNPADRGFVTRNHIEIGDGHQITSYARERRWHPSVYRHGRDVYLTGEHFLLGRFGRRKVADQIGPVESEPVRLARAILDPEHSSGRGIIERRTADWHTLDDGRRVIRLEQAFTQGGRHVYWLDPERGHALLRFAEAEGDGEPETLFEVHELAQVAADFWYPARVSSHALCPSPRQTSPVQVEAKELPTHLPPGVNAGEATHWATTHTARLPREDAIRCRYEFLNVRVGIEVPADAFEFRPPPV